MNARRELIKRLGLSTAWATPIVHSIMLPAHAMTTEAPPPEPTTITLTAVLNQGNEVPATGDPATGTSTMEFDSDTGDFTLSATAVGLVNFSVAHIHVGPLGVDGPVIADLTAGYTSGSINSTGTIPAANIADVIAGNTYINIHNADHPGGAIRGQFTI